MTSPRSPVAELAEELARARLRDNPFAASYMGVSGYDDAVPDLAPQARREWRGRLVDMLVRSEALEVNAAGTDAILLAAVRDDATRGLASADSRVEEWTVSTMAGGPTLMLLIAARAAVSDPASAAAYLQRCRRLAGFLDGTTDRLRLAAAEGLLPVAPLVANVITQLRAHLGHPDRDPLLAHPSPPGWDGAAAWRTQVEQAVTEQVRPALERHVELLRDLLPDARPPERAGLVHTPGGVSAYASCIRIGTTLALDPDDVHRTGLTALAEIEERIAELGGRAFGCHRAAEVMVRLREGGTREQFGADAMARAAAALARAEEALPAMFHPPLPPACAVEPMPAHLAESGAPPMYAPPAEDGSRPGAFLFNRTNPGPAGSWATECVAFHEGVPGHHAQFARLQLVPDLPLLLRAFVVVPHGEGWGLYAEQLADEFGLYSDDIQRLGMLACQAWRAVRLVVDTGLHARGWTRDRALTFAMEHTPMPRDFMSAEIDRYIAMPGQALGYLIGQREILRLRDEARAALRSAYDDRDFHSAVLDHGSLPLPALAQAVRGWVQAGVPEEHR